MTDIREYFKPQLTATPPIDETQIQEMIQFWKDNGDELDELNYRERFPIGDKRVYAVVRHGGVEIISLLESELEEFGKNHTLHSFDNPDLPQFTKNVGRSSRKSFMRLEQWYIHDFEADEEQITAHNAAFETNVEKVQIAIGYVFDNPKFDQGQPMRTSLLVEVNPNFVLTLNSRYALGEPNEGGNALELLKSLNGLG